MWNYASNAISGNLRSKKACIDGDCSDDEVSSCMIRDEGLECPICWESFNIVENVPYVLWCGHTLCKNCLLKLQWSVVKLPTAPIQLPYFISCPWCHILSFRLIYKGNLKFPRKNFFLLWMVENMNSDRPTARPCRVDNHPVLPSSGGLLAGSSRSVSHRNPIIRRAPYMRQEQADLDTNHNGNQSGNRLNVERINSSLRKLLAFFVHLTAKLPLILVFLLLVLYAIPASAILLALYVLISILFALPSFLVLYFAYPSLDWLVRELIN